MAPVLRTQRDVARWIAIQTSIALAAALPFTLIVNFLLLGGDLGARITVGKAMAIGLGLAFAEVVLFTPPIALRSVALLRELHVLSDQLERLAGADPLTSLLNRRGFDAAIARLPLGGAIATLVCDIDHFKRVNDRYGHECGDLALCGVADLVGEIAATWDSASAVRHGGEEFAIALPGASLEQARRIAERLRQSLILRPIEGPYGPLDLTMSIGVAAAQNFDSDIAPLLARADFALLRAKREGRNRVAAALDRAA
ncbi:MAG: GGDEF domain-containing protein [Roseiarcus sp.]